MPRAGRRRGAQPPAQRVIFRNALYAGEMAFLESDHADEAHRLGALEVASRQLIGDLPLPGMVRDQDQVGAEELVRIARKALSDAVGEEGNTRNRRHRNH